MNARTGIGSVSLGLALVATFAWTGHGVSGQAPARDGEWPTYGGDLKSTKYKPFDQINEANFSKLQVAWRFKTDNLGTRPETRLEGTPVMANGVLYATAGTRRSVVALDAVTGELLWVHGEHEGQRGAVSPRQLSGRGLSYWTDGKDERIYYTTPGYQLVALDARTGARVATFGNGGVVDLKQDDDQVIDPLNPDIGIQSPAAVTKDVIIVGAAFSDGMTPRSYRNIKGHVRGYDVRTGKRLWIFHTIPRPGEFGNDTWLKDSWAYTGNTGVWTQISVDEELGLVYLPVESPTGDYYGGHRPGNNLFGETLVAVDIKTGQRKWHYQLVHHGLWDFDIPAAPLLADITINGRTIKAVAQTTKQGILYVFDRATGEPVWPIPEVPVPAGDVPGEWYSPTQPMPTKPPAYNRNGISTDDLIDFTPELRAQAVKAVARYKLGPLFTPPIVSTADGPIATLAMEPGSNWPGASYDPETHVLYASACNACPLPIGLVPTPGPAFSDMNFVEGVAGQDVVRRVGGSVYAGADTPQPPRGGGNVGAPVPTVQGLPVVKPPYGIISAIDLDKGEIRWQVPHGDTPDAVRNSPLLKGLDIPKTGQPSAAGVGTIVTRTLLVAGDPQVTTTPTHPRGAMLRAYDKASGREVGAVLMPAPQSGAPMTYMVGGRQFIVVGVSGGGYSGEYIAFSLPPAK